MTSESPGSPATPGDDVRPSLLIADDSELVRTVLASQLADDFRVVATAADAAEAVDQAGQHRPDAALVDVEMPEGGARRAVPGIRERSPATAIVVLSADESHGSVLELVNAGAVAYLRKGVAAPEIVATLTEAIRSERG